MLSRACYAAIFLFTASLGVVFVFLADLQERNGLSDFELGVVASAGFVAALVTQLTLSPFVDRGHASIMVWVAVVAGTVGSIAFPLVGNVWLFAGCRALVGVGQGLFGVTARKALIGLDAEGGGAKVGALFSAAVVGFIAGPAIGAAGETISFAAPFVFVGCGILVAGSIAARLIARTEVAVTEVVGGDYLDLIARPAMQAAIVVQVTIFGYIGIFDSVVDRFLTDLGATTMGTALVLVVVGSPLFVLPKRTGALAERLGGARVALPGLLMLPPAFLGYALTGSPVVFALIGVVAATAEAFASMGAQVLVLETTGAARAAIGSAVLEATGLLVAAITSILGPVIYGNSGAGVLFGGYSLIAVVLAVVVWSRLRAARLSPSPSVSLEGAPCS